MRRGTHEQYLQELQVKMGVIELTISPNIVNGVLENYHVDLPGVCCLGKIARSYEGFWRYYNSPYWDGGNIYDDVGLMKIARFLQHLNAQDKGLTGKVHDK